MGPCAALTREMVRGTLIGALNYACAGDVGDPDLGGQLRSEDFGGVEIQVEKR